MRALYEFPTSVFSRRTRLLLAHKGLEVELRDARSDDTLLSEARKLSPLATMPVLDDERRVVGDSTAIAVYLDLAYPDRPLLWPRGKNAGHVAVCITSHVDVAVNTLAELGTRYWPLRNDRAWDGVVREKMGRAQAAIEAVAAEATRPNLAGDSWSVADIWALSATLWIAGMPARAPTAPLIAQILTLGFKLPEALVRWAKNHEDRADVKAIYS